MGFDKLLAPLGGKPVLQWSLDAFREAPSIDRIVVVGPEERFAQLETGGGTPVTRVEGDRERYLSVMRGLMALPEEDGLVAVHDGARPLIGSGQIETCLATAREQGACALARRVTETLKRSDEEGFANETVSRDRLWAMETPQVFRLNLLRRAYAEVSARGVHVTDDVSAAEFVGVRSKLIENDRPNIKITVRQDLVVAEALVRGAGPEDR